MKFRNVENGNLPHNGTESLTSSRTPDRLLTEEISLDQIISRYIKAEEEPAKHHAALSVGLEAMAKRDHLGIVKNQEAITTNGTSESGFREESVVEGRDALGSPGPGEPDRKYVRCSDCENDLNRTVECVIRECAVEARNGSSGSHWREQDRSNLIGSDVSNGLKSKVECVVDGSCAPRPREEDRQYQRRSAIYQSRRSESPQCSSAIISRQDFPLSFGSSSRRSSSYDCDVIDEVEKYFNKRFRLSCRNNWKLPKPSEVFTAKPWEVKELLECKDKLNAVKEKLNDLNLKDWHAHTKKRNKAGLIIWKLRRTVSPEFPTQAWCKFYENVCSFDLVPKKAKQDKMLNSVHLCEAPGAFITSLNHYIKTNFDDDFQWNWLGTTLNPHYEGNPLSLMINEDRFILHTLDHWTFGDDYTGDLMSPPNVADLMDKADYMGEVLLVTADGSIDCQDDPGEQENYVAWLHYCEAFAAMMVLAVGGNFLLKMFTMFEHMTVSLLYLLSCVFEEVIVNKPATSKEGNSETYVVCKNFSGKAVLEPLLAALTRNYGPNHPRKALFSRESIPEEFVQSVIECADTFRKYQSDIIEANLESFEYPNEQEIKRNARIRGAVADEFFRRYRLKDLPEKYDIVGRKLINKMETYNLDPRLEVGSFNDRLRRAGVSDRQKMLDMKADIELLDREVLDQWPADMDIWWHSVRIAKS